MENNAKEIQRSWDKLSAEAIPKNSAWRKLEALNFDPDYADADAGEAKELLETNE